MPSVRSTTSAALEVPPKTRTYEYAVQPADTCYLIHTTFRLTLAQFLAQNKGLKCNALRARTSVNVTAVASHLNCAALYPLDQGDTCASVEALFGLAGGLEGLNPGLDCSRLFPGQQVCIAVSEDQPTSPPPCGLQQSLEASLTCSEFRMLSNLSPPAVLPPEPRHLLQQPPPPARPALARPDGVRQASRLWGRAYLQAFIQAAARDSCASVIYKKFRKSAFLFKALNGQMSSATGSLFVNQLFVFHEASDGLTFMS